MLKSPAATQALTSTTETSAAAVPGAAASLTTPWYTGEGWPRGAAGERNHGWVKLELKYQSAEARAKKTGRRPKERCGGEPRERERMEG